MVSIRSGQSSTSDRTGVIKRKIKSERNRTITFGPQPATTTLITLNKRRLRNKDKKQFQPAHVAATTISTAKQPLHPRHRDLPRLLGRPHPLQIIRYFLHLTLPAILLRIPGIISSLFLGNINSALRHTFTLIAQVFICIELAKFYGRLNEREFNVRKRFDGTCWTYEGVEEGCLVMMGFMGAWVIWSLGTSMAAVIGGWAWA